MANGWPTLRMSLSGTRSTVQTFPTPGGKWQISINGGSRPVWSRDGRELYFISADGKMMAAEIKPGPKWEAQAWSSRFSMRISLRPTS